MDALKFSHSCKRLLHDFFSFSFSFTQDSLLKFKKVLHFGLVFLVIQVEQDNTDMIYIEKKEQD